MAATGAEWLTTAVQGHTHTHMHTLKNTHTLAIKTKLLGIDAWPMLRHSQKISRKYIPAIQPYSGVWNANTQMAT